MSTGFFQAVYLEVCGTGDIPVDIGRIPLWPAFAIPLFAKSERGKKINKYSK